MKSTCNRKGKGLIRRKPVIDYMGIAEYALMRFGSMPLEVRKRGDT